MEIKKLSKGKMDDIVGKITKVERVRRLQKERFAELIKNGFDFNEPSLLKDVLQDGNEGSSLYVFKQIQLNLSMDDWCKVIKAVIDGHLPRKILSKLRPDYLGNILFSDGNDKLYRERALLLLKLIELKVLDELLLYRDQYRVCWQYAGKEIIDAVIGGYVSDVVFSPITDKLRFKFPEDVVEYCMQMTLEGKLAENILLDILESKWLNNPIYKHQSYINRVKPLLLKGFCEGKISDKGVERVLKNWNCEFFTDGDWQEMFDSGRECLVQSYLEKFYPEIKVEF